MLGDHFLSLSYYAYSSQIINAFVLIITQQRGVQKASVALFYDAKKRDQALLLCAGSTDDTVNYCLS